MTDELNKILNSSDKGVEESSGVLTRLFRQILADMRIGPLAWDSLMNQYLVDPRNGIPDNGKDRSTERGNLNKKLRSRAMTWKGFEKGLRFLSPIKVRFEIHMTWRNRRTTIHGVNVPLVRGPLPDDDDDGEE